MNNFFVEFGSSDFDTLIPLASNGWGGIVVEPVIQYLENLKRYDSVIYENIALCSYDGETSFIYYDKSLPASEDDGHLNWVKGVGTDNLEHNHMISNPQWKEYERVITIDCLTLDSLLEKHKISAVDFMKVDVEGNEYSIFSNYSWNIKPTMIKMETNHWEDKGVYYRENIKELMFDMLKKNGYIIWEENYDLYAIR